MFLGMLSWLSSESILIGAVIVAFIVIFIIHVGGYIYARRYKQESKFLSRGGADPEEDIDKY